MKHLITVFFAFVILSFSPGYSQIFEENFNYVAGTNLTDNGWTAHSGGGTNPITVSSSGLTYTGYPSSGIGNSALVDNTGEDDSRTFTAQTTGDIYASFLVNISAIPTAGYFFHLGPSPIGTNFQGRVWAQDNAGNLNFGLSRGSLGTPTYSPTSFSYNTTYLFVLKYSIISGAANDAVSLFVFTDPSLPASEPGTPTIGPLTEASADPSNIGTVALRQFNASQNITVDGIRIGSLWSDSPLPVELTSFSAIGGDGKVTLRWATASEVNNVGYILERAYEKDGEYEIVAAYNSIPELRGAGNTSEPQNYAYVDQTVFNGFSYWYKLIDVDINGVRTAHGPIAVVPNAAAVVIDVVDRGEYPAEFSLAQNYPNPFNPNTTIRFAIPQTKSDLLQVNLSIFNALGQRVATLYNGPLAPNTYTMEWNATNDFGKQVPSGVYFYVLNSTNFTSSRKMILVK